MPPARNSPPVPIDKSKYGMNSRMSPSHLMDIKKMATIARVNATKVEGTNNHNPATDIYQTRRAGIMISALKTIPKALCYTCPFERVFQFYITTIAGTGTSGYNGDSISATSADLSDTQGICVDSVGNVYIADSNSHRIRKVDINGTITTIAGTGTLGYNGDSISAITAQLRFPVGVCVDRADNIYIADQQSARIRKVDAVTKIITTIAGTGTSGYSGDGGLAIAADLGLPQKLSVDSAGNIYFAAGNFRIRKLTLA